MFLRCTGVNKLGDTCSFLEMMSSKKFTFSLFHRILTGIIEFLRPKTFVTEVHLCTTNNLKIKYLQNYNLWRSNSPHFVKCWTFLLRLFFCEQIQPRRYRTCGRSARSGPQYRVPWLVEQVQGCPGAFAGPVISTGGCQVAL